MDQTRPVDQRLFTRRHVGVRWTRHAPQHPEEFHVTVMGGIGVGGYRTGREDEELALVGLEAMGL